uniref:Uncharacterized protein n=1 Tax=Kalanchoe fedtschenkoi TaxID=63787 RepID=A0A7N1A685_KALFE
MSMSMSSLGEKRFFDSLDYVVSEDGSGQVYEVWMNEPFKSVQERREDFMRKMCVEGLARANDVATERITACGGAELISSEALPVDGAEGDTRICWADKERSNSETEGSFNREGVKTDEETEPIMYRKLARLLSSSSGSVSSYECSEGHVKLRKNWINDKKRVVKWWKSLSGKWGSESGSESDFDTLSCSPAFNMGRVKVHSKNKRVMELSAVYTGQNISAHCGMIRTMKFSPDGRYLASGGEDGAVRVWLVTSVDGSSKHSTTGSNFGDDLKQGKSLRRNKSKYASVVIPDKIMHIEESPLHEFYGHSGEILDLAWSKSNVLLSSSTDKTVRMWQVGCSKCLNVFPHSSYVTCIQFTPADDNHFISGSLDGKVRIWKVSRGRVVDWVDARDIVTAICYQPDGRGFAVGSFSGNCRFYRLAEKHMQLEAEVHINGTSNTKITGIEFSAEANQQVIVTLEDSKVHILDRVHAIDKYRGLSNLGRKMSTSRVQHVVSVGEDSHVYIWDYNQACTQRSAKTALRSCEHFVSEGVSVAIPWLMKPSEEKELEVQSSLERQNHLDAASWLKDLETLSGVNRFSLEDTRGRKSATWPAEQLPLSDSSHEDHLHPRTHPSPPRQREHVPTYSLMPKDLSVTWGLVIVTACHNGTIKTYHNYGLPVKL